MEQGKQGRRGYPWWEWVIGALLLFPLASMLVGVAVPRIRRYLGITGISVSSVAIILVIGILSAVFGTEPTPNHTARVIPTPNRTPTQVPTLQPQQGLVVKNISRDQVGTLSDTQVLYTFIDCWEKDEFGWEVYRHGLDEYLRDTGIPHRWDAPGDVHEWLYTLSLEYGKPGLDAEYELYGVMRRGLRACLN